VPPPRRRTETETAMESSPDKPPLTAADRIERLSTYALIRTAFSVERSLLAWMRSSASLFSLGFSLSKFLDYLEGEGAAFPAGARRLALALVVLGIVSLALGLGDQLRRTRTLRGLGLPASGLVPTASSRFSLPVAGALILLTIGVLALIGVTLNMAPS